MKTRTLVVAALCAGCASAAEPDGAWQDKLAAGGWKLGDEVPSVANFTLAGYETLDSRHVVVHTSVTRSVLVTLGPGCTGLRRAHRIAIKGTPGSFGRLDKLLVHTAGVTENCIVETLHKLERG